MALESSSKLKKGDATPSFNLKCIDGKTHSLQEFKGSKALLAIFMCNHCPYVKAKVKRMNEIYEKYSRKGVAILGINSNDPKEYPEDSFEGMTEFAKERNIKFHYMVDETQEVARAYGAVCTPDPFLFDSNFKLVYHGRFDNALNPEEKPTDFIMEKAIDAVLQEKPFEKDFLPSRGCSIKWRK